MSAQKLVLVTGATGQQGGAAVNALLEHGHRVRGLTRNPDSEKARALAARGVEVVTGDFERIDSLVAAATGVDAVYGMTTMFEAGVEAETSQGKALVDAVKQAGVQHLVFGSVASADQNTGIPHFDSKFKVEEYIKASGINYTIIAPVSFMDNFLGPWFLPGLGEGKLAMAVPAETELQHVSVRDIGRFAAVLVDRGASVYGHRFDIAGDDLTGPEAAGVIGAATGIETAYTGFPAEAMREQDEDMYLMFDWFGRVGYSVDIAALRRDFPKVGWQTLADWASIQDWSAMKTPEVS